MKQTPDIIFFGGTFDPPHAGHLSGLRIAARAFPSANIIIIPAAVPASAGRAQKQPALPFKERMKLCQIAFSDIGPRVCISDIESKLPAPNYTANTVAALAASHPGKTLGMLIGMDQFAQFTSWKNPLLIASHVHLIVVGRDQDDAASQETFRKSLEALKNEFVKNPGTAPLKEVYFLPGITSEASSTDLRHVISSGKDVPKGWLEPAVEDYIKKENFYSGDN